MNDRREFLKRGAVLALGAGVAGLPAGQRFDPEPPLFRISLAQWSLHRRLLGRAKPPLDNLDFAATARALDIDAIEYVNTFFKKKAGDEKYLSEMKTRARDHGVKSLLIMIDREGALGDANSRKRARAVVNHHKWVDAAKFLGCHSIRVNAQSSGTWPEQRDRAAEGLRYLSEYGASRSINVIVENHGGLSSNGAWLAEVMKTVDHPRCGTLPDFGNFHLGGGKWYDRYKGVAELMPYAKAVSAKSNDFDESGEETRTDFKRMMKIVLDAGYDGWVGIEFEGGGLDEMEGIRKTKLLLERVRRELEAEK